MPIIMRRMRNELFMTA